MTEPAWYQFTLSKDKLNLTAEQLGHWFDEHGAREWCIGNETGLEGYQHFQAVVHFKKGTSWSVLKQLVAGIGQVTPSHTHDFEYAMKTGDYIASWEGALTKFKNLKLQPWEETIIKQLSQQNDRKIMVVQDFEGGLGKSTFAKYLEANRILDVCPVVSDEYNDYTGYCFEYQKPGYCFDIPRAQSIKRRMAMWSGIEQIKNGLLFEKRYKPRKAWIDPPKILIFTNDDLPLDALSKDRWSIWTPYTLLGLTDITEVSVLAGKPCNID